MSEQKENKRVGDDLVISDFKRRDGGSTMLTGTLADLEFFADILPPRSPEHNRNGNSSIARLSIWTQGHQEDVFEWAFGYCLKPARDQRAQAIVDFLRGGRLEQIAFPDLKSCGAKSIGRDLQILELGRVAYLCDPRRSGVCIAGTVSRNEFIADIFPKHPAITNWDIGESRISKLLVHNERTCVFNWSRGKNQGVFVEQGREVPMKELSSRETRQTRAVVEFLASGVLTDFAFQYQHKVVPNKSVEELQRAANMIRFQMKERSLRNERESGQRWEVERD